MKNESENYLNLDLFKVSSIGTNVDDSDDKLLVKMEYTVIGHFFVWFFGTTRMPIKISFTCIKTNENFEELLDKKLIENYMHYCRR